MKQKTNIKVDTERKNKMQQFEEFSLYNYMKPCNCLVAGEREHFDSIADQVRLKGSGLETNALFRILCLFYEAGC